METAIAYHKYSFRGELRTYRNKLTLVGEGVDYLGTTDDFINHWTADNKPVKKMYWAYLVDGNIRYYEVERPISLFNSFSKRRVEFLEVTENPPKSTGLKINHISDQKYNSSCVYCGVQLNYKIYTRDHLIPKSRGGRADKKNMRPCCKTCNTEKGIQYLNLLLMDVTGDELIKLQTKIKNANKLAIEISTNV